MKVLKQGVVAAVILALAAFGFYGCLKGGTIDTITVTPASPTIAKGTTNRFTATAHFTDGTILDWTAAVTWKSSDETSVTISNDSGYQGLATSLSTSVYTAPTSTIVITAYDATNNISGQATLYVTDPQDIKITPPHPFMAVNTTHQFSATAILRDLASALSSSSTATITQDITSFMTWSVSLDSAVTSTATPASVGTTGFVSAESVTGNFFTIHATYSASTMTYIQKTQLLTITDVAMSSLTVTPSLAVITALTTTQQQFAAWGYYIDPHTSVTTTQDFTDSVTWSSSNTAIATIDSTSGLVTAATTGITTISAVDPITGLSSSATLSVN